MVSDLDNNYLEALTKREMEVLRLLSTGASNQEIADALVVEVSTVKWYNSQIYEKLQVKNRKQAIIRARTLGILESNTSDPLFRIQHNLPADTFPFIGREQEIQELVQYLSDESFRLITILGIGGMGKTRLSIEVGRRLISYFRDGVYFIPLSPVTPIEQILTTLADVIGFKFHSDNQPRQQLLEYLNHQHLLLIMDNFEHLLDSAELLSDILQNAPQIKVLVTSREKLNLAGEVVYLLNGLALPFEAATQVSADYDAVKLFLASAQRINVRIDNREIPLVARICQLLGGMPLGILLASAWLDTLSLTEIEAEIQLGLGILEANLRDAPVRHHSIQAAFDSSWKRLSTQEQTIFMRLSVFRDGFTREAAQMVTGGSIRDLQRLVHTSFIQLLPSGRYVIHELMRQYGEQKLKASGELEATQVKHAQNFAEFIKPLGNTPWGMATREVLATVNADFENVRAAWLFQTEQRNLPELRRFLDGIWHFLDQYSRSQEGVDLFESLLSTLSDDNDDVTLFRAQLLARLGWFYSDTGQHQRAVEVAQNALKVFEIFDASDDIAFVCLSLYLVYGFVNNQQQCIQYAQKGFELVQKLKKSKWYIPCSYVMTVCLLFDLDKIEEGVYLLNTIPEYKTKSLLETHFLEEAGEYLEAEQRILNILQKYHFHRIDYTISYGHLTRLAVLSGNTERAWKYTQRGLQYADENAYAWGNFLVLTSTLRLLISEKQYHHATKLLSFMLHHPANIEGIRASVSNHIETLKANLTPNEFESAWERGKQLDLGGVITEYMER